MLRMNCRVLDVRIDTNSGEHEVGLTAVGDVLVDKIDVGDYAATPAWKLPRSSLFAVCHRHGSARSNDVSITSGKAIRQVPGG
jgi:hypothetical protein